MANLPTSFNAADVSDDLIPEGEYVAQITKSEMKDTKDKTGKYLQLGFIITAGKYAKRMVFVNLNLVNNNTIAVEISQKTLARICKAVGKDYKTVRDSAEIHGIPLVIKITQRPAEDAYPGNDIKGYKPLDGDAAVEAGAPIRKNPFKKG